MFLAPIEGENPTYTTPYAITALALVNVACFFYAHLIVGREEAFVLWGYIPQNDELRTVFTSMFMHGGGLHLVANLIFLWMFGDNVEDVLGPVVFLFAYLAAGFVAANTHWLTNQGAEIPMIGASGAVSGVIGMYLVFFPKIKADLVFFLLFWEVRRYETNVQAAVIIWFLMQFILAILFDATGLGEFIRIAFWAHIGGFIAGVTLGIAFRKIGLLASYASKYGVDLK